VCQLIEAIRFSGMYEVEVEMVIVCMFLEPYTVVNTVNFR
jgi:hypothetical protein